MSEPNDTREEVEARQAISDAQDAIGAEPALREWSRCSVGDFPFQIRELLSYYRGSIRTINVLDEAKKQLEAATREKDAEIERLKRVEEFVELTGRARAVMDRAQFAEAELHDTKENYQTLLDDAVEMREQLASLRAALGGEKWIEVKEGCAVPEYGEMVHAVCTSGDMEPWQEIFEATFTMGWKAMRACGVPYWKPLNWPEPLAAAIKKAETR